MKLILLIVLIIDASGATQVLQIYVSDVMKVMALLKTQKGQLDVKQKLMVGDSKTPPI